jgi:hypothetical protein
MDQLNKAEEKAHGYDSEMAANMQDPYMNQKW